MDAFVAPYVFAKALVDFCGRRWISFDDESTDFEVQRQVLKIETGPAADQSAVVD